MGINEKIAEAKKTKWVVEGMSEAHIKTTVELARISARIEKCRLDMGMTQQEFAEYMGVSQGMVSKWESTDYNFTIKALNEICEKLKLTLNVEINEVIKDNYVVIRWNEDRVLNTKHKNNWIKEYDYEGAIA